MKRILIILSLLLATGVCIADDTCDEAIQEGIEDYRSGKLKEALDLFRFAEQECGSAYQSTVSNISTGTWVGKCRKAMAAKESAAKEAAEREAAAQAAAEEAARKAAAAVKPATQPVTKPKPAAVAPLKPRLSVSATGLRFGAEGGQKQGIIVSCTTDWGFTYSYSDAARQNRSVRFSFERSQDTLFVECKENTTGREQRAYFSIFAREDKSINAAITLAQEAAAPTVSACPEETAPRQEAATAQQAQTAAETVWRPDLRTGSYRAAKDYYGWAGTRYLSIIGGGYTFDLPDNRGAATVKHIVDISVLDWRVRWFGMSLLNFELELGDMYPDKIDHRAIYKPAVNFYIPLCKAMAMKLYGGAEADMSYIYQAKPGYDYDFERDFFMNAYGGLGLQIVPHGIMPIELSAEYRYPIPGLTKAQDRLSQGFYFTGRFYLGVPIHR